MTHFKTSKAELLFVALPKEYDKYTIQRYPMSGDWIMELNSKGLNHWKVNIPRGYTILGKLSTISEEVAKGLVDAHVSQWFTDKFYYKNYIEESKIFDNATASLTSIATQLGMELTDNIYILKRI